MGYRLMLSYDSRLTTHDSLLLLPTDRLTDFG
jgi:hypothetical protein